MRTSKKEPEKIDENALLAACKKGGEDVGRLIDKVLETQPELLLRALTTVKASLNGIALLATQKPNAPLIEALVSQEETSALANLAKQNLTEYQHSLLEEKLMLNILQLELHNAMFRYVLCRGDDKLTSAFVLELHQVCSPSEKLLLDNLGQWSTATYAEWGRALVLRAGSAAKQVAAKSAHAKDIEHADAEREEQLKQLNQIKREGAESVTLAVGIAKLITSSEFQEAIQNIGLIDQTAKDKFIAHLTSVFMDLDFDNFLKIVGHSNDALLDIAKRLEICHDEIENLTDRVMKNTSLACHKKIFILHALQMLNRRVEESKQHLVNEMFQRLHYIEPAIIANLGKEKATARYLCPSRQYNELKYIKDKTERFYSVRGLDKKSVNRYAAKPEKQGQVDSMTAAQIVKYMLCIANAGTKMQKEKLRMMLGVVEDPRMDHIIALAKQKEIIITEDELLHFRSQPALFLGGMSSDACFKTFTKVISMCKRKLDYDVLMLKFGAISSPDLRELACQFIMSDADCTEYNDAHGFILLLEAVEKNNDVHRLLMDVMEKFQPVSLQDIKLLMKVFIKSAEVYGQVLLPMYFMNCLENQTTLDDFMRTTVDCSNMLKENPFLYVLYNYMERHRIGHLYDKIFGKVAVSEQALLEEVIGSQQGGQLDNYTRGLSFAAGCLLKEMKDLNNRELYIEQILSYVVCVTNLVKAAASPEKQNIEDTMGIFMRVASAAVMLRELGFDSVVANVMHDKIASVSEALNSENQTIRSRAMLMELLLYIASAKHLDLDGAMQLINLTFALSRAVKTAEGLTNKEKLNLLAAGGALINEARKGQENHAKLERYFKAFLMMKGAKLVSKEFEEFKAVLKSTSALEGQVRSVSEPSVLHARNPIVSQPAPVRQSSDASDIRTHTPNPAKK